MASPPPRRDPRGRGDIVAAALSGGGPRVLKLSNFCRRHLLVVVIRKRQIWRDHFLDTSSLFCWEFISVAVISEALRLFALSRPALTRRNTSIQVMRINLLLALLLSLSAPRAFSWTEGELVIWLSDNRGFRSWMELGKKFEQEMGVAVKVETQEQITEKFQAAAQGGKGPDIFLWAHDRIGEWADGGLLKPLEISEGFKTAFIPMSWDAVTHNKQTWGYPVALECVSLVVNKKLVSGKPPSQLSEFPEFAKELKEKDPKVMAIMWDYKTPYFGFPFLASAGAYTFKKTESGYDTKDVGVDNAGAIEGLKMIVDLINAGVLPKGSTQNVGEQKMATGELATWLMAHGRGPTFARVASISTLLRYPGLTGTQESRSSAS